MEVCLGTQTLVDFPVKYYKKTKERNFLYSYTICFVLEPSNSALVNDVFPPCFREFPGNLQAVAGDVGASLPEVDLLLTGGRLENKGAVQAAYKRDGLKANRPFFFLKKYQRMNTTSCPI